MNKEKSNLEIQQEMDDRKEYDSKYFELEDELERRDNL